MRQVLAVMLALTAGLAQAQVTASQGNASESAAAPRRFRSPMVLEVPFAGADRKTWNTGQLRGQNLAPYSCDGVSFRDFAISVSKLRRGRVEVVYHIVLVNEPGVDKVADVRIELLRGATVIAAQRIPWFQVEEGRISIRQTKLLLNETSLTTDPNLSLRITLSVRDDT